MLKNFLNVKTNTQLDDKRIIEQIQRIEQKIDILQQYSHGARAVYLGNNRVLMKAVVFGANIAFILESDDRLLSPWFIVSGEYETALTNYFVPRLKPDSICLDVGANFGYFTCLFSRFCPNGKIIGIEPDEKVFSILRENIMINGFSSQAQALNAAVSSNNDKLKLFRRSTRSGNTSLIKVSDEFTSSLGEAPAVLFEVDSVTVDQLCEKLGGRLNFLKIDVEGAEPLVFKGARSTIENNPDLNIVMEWSPHQIISAGFKLEELVAQFRDYDLEACSIDQSGHTKNMPYEELLLNQYMTGILLRKRSST